MSEHPETVSDYEDDPRSGDLYEAPAGEALGPQSDPVVLPEDNLQPGKQFDFADPDVVENFEEKVIRTQIPGYDQMRLRALQMGHLSVQENSAVLDLGTSRGKMIRDLVQVLHETDRDAVLDTVSFVGVDTEQPMLDSARVSVNQKFRDIGQTDTEAVERVHLKKHDLRESIPFPGEFGKSGYSLVTSILTLQFVPVEYRQRIVRDIYESLLPGGAFILTEKVLGTSWKSDQMMTEAYHDHKRRNGITQAAITNKRKAIERFLVPQTHEANVRLLEQAGFSTFSIDTFWRDLQFESIIAIKD